MNKKTASATITTTALIVSIMFGAPVVEVAEANFMPFYNAVINVQSPQNGTVYNRRTLSLNFTVESNQEDQMSTRYFLNSENPVDVDTPVVSSRIETMQVWDGWSSEPNQTKRYVVYTAEGNTVLANLADGAYNLTIQRYFTYPVTQEVAIYNATTVTFIIDTTAPVIQIIQPENKTYSTASIPLDFTLSETSTVRYSLDGQENRTLAGNTTLTNLLGGVHSVTIYANDAAGNAEKSDSIFFTILTTEPSPSLSHSPSLSPSATQHPTFLPNSMLNNTKVDSTPTLIIASSTALIAALAVIFYFKKRKG